VTKLTKRNLSRQTYIVEQNAPALACYPHAHRAGPFLFLSGTSSRRHDNSHAGVEVLEDGRVIKDIEAQTYAVIENMKTILAKAELDLSHLVDLSVFLVSMDDYAGFNRVYNTYFNANDGPARTTIGVAQLPHPNLLIEIKATAVFPEPPLNRD